MRFDYLKTFLTVAKTHSFSVAAKELRTTQGTVSHHIAALEEYFDAVLFKRAIKGVELTDAGKMLKESAEQILGEVESAKAKISSTKDKFAGVIKIAASTIPGEHVIPGIIANFQTNYPYVKFKIKAEDSLKSLESLQANEVDFAVVGSLKGFNDKLEAIEVGEDKLVLIVPSNHELSKRKSVKLSEILKYPYINREESSGTRQEVEKMMNDSKIQFSKLNTKLELGSTEAVITAVSEENGVSIISSIAAKKAQAAGLIKIVNFQDINAVRKLYLVKPKRPLSEASESFWDFCKKRISKKMAV